jgi:hypothetical protein
MHEQSYFAGNGHGFVEVSFESHTLVVGHVHVQGFDAFRVQTPRLVRNAKKAVLDLVLGVTEIVARVGLEKCPSPVRTGSTNGIHAFFPNDESV